MALLDKRKHDVTVFVYHNDKLVNTFVEHVHLTDLPENLIDNDEITSERENLASKLSRTSYGVSDEYELVAVGDAISYPLVVHGGKRPRRWLLVRAENGVLSADAWSKAFDTLDEARYEMNRQILELVEADTSVDVELEDEEYHVYADAPEDFELCDDDNHGWFDACDGPEWQIFDTATKNR